MTTDLDRLDALDDTRFRAEVRGWIEVNYPPHLRNPSHRLHFAETGVWYRTLAAKGWLCPGWPRKYGGMGLSAARQLILIEEFQRHGCADFNHMGISMLGPLLIQYGTETQKAFFLPKVLSGDHIWCQGYSEPNSGSDLASLRTSAVAEGECWRINGQKTWTTLATDANWMFLLARTDPDARKQEGISFLLVEMDSPGITVRPIKNLGMHDEFCEVFFDDVRIPKERLVGEVNRGWAMAKTLLGFERIGFGSPRQSEFALTRLRRLAEHVGLWDDPLFRDRYSRFRMDLADHKDLYETFADKVRRGQDLGADVGMLKLHQTELYQRISDAMIEISGLHAGASEPIAEEKEMFPAAVFLQARPSTIAGGSSEILRGILAKSVLGLP
jgi:alkylation response protein AidB-like acyl-CoA dehydrogenase